MIALLASEHGFYKYTSTLNFFLCMQTARGAGTALILTLQAYIVSCSCRLPGVQTWSSNWDVLLENTMDPSHACFLHDGIAGKWEEAAPLTMHLKHNKIDANQVSALVPMSNILYVNAYFQPSKH